jgi:PKD repeat protein
MRKIYFLLLLTGLSFVPALAQDAANFTFTFGSNNVVHFTNTTTTTGDAVRKAVWSFGDGQSSTTGAKEGTEHLYATAGTYTVCLKIYKQVNNDFVLSTQECKQVVIAASATCKADFSTEPVIATPLARKFIALPTNSLTKKPVKICWRFGDGKEECREYTTQSTGPYVADHTYATNGQYEVCVTIKYDGGCEAKMCKLVAVVSPPPLATCEMKFSELATSLTNAKRTFYASVMTNRVAEKICWTYGDGKESCTLLTNPLAPQSLTTTHEYAAPGVYKVCAKVMYAGGCVADYCREVVIRTGTTSCGGYMTDSVTELRTVLFKGFGVQSAADHVINYRWTFGDGTTGSGAQTKHTYATGGNYEVCLTMVTDLGCETRICKRLAVAGNNEPTLKVSPNPVYNELHVTFRSNRAEMIVVSIYNANGLILKSYQRNAVVGLNTWGFDVSGLPPGIYSVVIRSPNQIANALFTKQ